MINQKPKNTPMRNPTSTWVSVCCLSIMRLLPTTPATRKMTHSHHIGLKTKSSENASSAPAKPPMAAVCCWKPLRRRCSTLGAASLAC